MNRRVFQIDQECFMIYVEDMSSTKERFLRIGNSSFLKEFGENLTFVTLLSKMYPGDPFHELDIFRPNVDRKIIGLKESVKRFLFFLKENKINVNKVNVVYAEEASDIFKEVNSEEDFLKKIENDSRINRHSFASFYNDGNIRIFNQNEVFFDLREALFKTLNESHEIKKLAQFFLKYYQESYNKTGIIHSNKSLFVFSENKFACITDSSSWVKDAIRVGIDPSKIDLIYVTERTMPGILCLKTILKRDKDDPKIKLIYKEQVRWEKLLSPDNIVSLNSHQKSISQKIGNINLKFKENEIEISTNGFKFFLEDSKSFLDKGSIIKGKFNESSIRKDFELIIDDFKKDSLTLYSYNPVIFEKIIDENNYINTFWENFSENIKDNNSMEIFDDDTEYSKDYIPKIVKKNFYSKLYAETIRRINCEGNSKITDNVFKEYMNLLEELSGENINENKFVIEQVLGYGANEKRVCIRDFLGSKEIEYFEDKINPFLNFLKNAEKKEWQERQDQYRKKYKLNIKDNKIMNQIGTRFSDVINAKQFHIEERERLKRFMETVIIKEKQEENKERAKRGESVNTAKAQEDELKNAEKHGKELGAKKDFEWTKGKKTFFIAAILLIALIIASLFLIPFLKEKGITKDKIQSNIQDKIQGIIEDKKIVLDKNREDRYIKTNEKSFKRSNNLKFFMTVLDLLNLTNVVAEKNGYHRIVEDFEKPNVKGKDPDWIYPGNVLIMPDSAKINVKKGDIMWNLCEDFLIDQINNHEIEIQKIIEKNESNEININQAKEEFLKIKDESYSEMLRDFIDEIVELKNFDDIENLLKNSQ